MNQSPVLFVLRWHKNGQSVSHYHVLLAMYKFQAGQQPFVRRPVPCDIENALELLFYVNGLSVQDNDRRHLIH